MLAIFGYRFLVDIVDIVLGNDTQPQVTVRDKNKFDERDRDVVMLLNLFVKDEILPKVQIGKTSIDDWNH